MVSQLFYKLNHKKMQKVVSSAKRETYMENLKMGIIKTNAIKVLNFIKDNPNCNTDKIRLGLSMAHQTATSVISNLLDLGIIKITGETKIKNSFFSSYVLVENYIEQDDLAKRRKKEKFNAWMEQGLANYKEEMSLLFLNNLISESDIFKLNNK